MTVTHCPQPETLRQAQANIDSKIAQFLASGGVIKQIPRGQSGECLRVAPCTADTTRRSWAKVQNKQQIKVSSEKKRTKK
ncbi:hypothetical protein MJO52_12015 [Microbulbifer variabilis]|uniref:Transcriptional regulator SutA RNAP-binding domain-containing protein n=1 Tax=Microbulbifer variabilis TaxID=266805 RepID=A0ABY4V6A8_9GAMM|nr:hypothetical protein [Microbulbifer variabilis]USD19807.1 hypothetical protein MJO52_12015 [Microbulbifer variabilis]